MTIQLAADDGDFYGLPRDSVSSSNAGGKCVTDGETSPTWVGLTDKEIEQFAVDAGIVTWVKRVYDPVDKKFYDLPLGEGMQGDAICLKQFAHLICAKLKEENT
jgi:hypothetical protein